MKAGERQREEKQRRGGSSGREGRENEGKSSSGKDAVTMETGPSQASHPQVPPGLHRLVQIFKAKSCRLADRVDGQRSSILSFRFVLSPSLLMFYNIKMFQKK